MSQKPSGILDLRFRKKRTFKKNLPEILIHVLQRLEALGQIFIVELWAEVVGVLLDEALGAHNVGSGSTSPPGRRPPGRSAAAA